LTYDAALALGRDEGEDLAKVKVNILVHGREVTSVSRVRIAGVQENEYRFGERFDDGLHMRRRRRGQCDVIVAETWKQISGSHKDAILQYTCVELDWGGCQATELRGG